jgi:hypothetical protein
VVVVVVVCLGCALGGGVYSGISYISGSPIGYTNLTGFGVFMYFGNYFSASSFEIPYATLKNIIFAFLPIGVTFRLIGLLKKATASAGIGNLATKLLILA